MFSTYILKQYSIYNRVCALRNNDTPSHPPAKWCTVGSEISQMLQRQSSFNTTPTNATLSRWQILVTEDSTEVPRTRTNVVSQWALTVQHAPFHVVSLCVTFQDHHLTIKWQLTVILCDKLFLGGESLSVTLSPFRKARLVTLRCVPVTVFDVKT